MSLENLALKWLTGILIGLLFFLTVNSALDFRVGVLYIIGALIAAIVLWGRK